DRARDGIAETEGAEDEARPLERASADEGSEQHEQQKAFERRLVELARMTRQRPAGRKHHSPRQVGRPAPKLAVAAIGDSGRKESDGSGCAGDGAQGKEGKPA